MFRHTSTANPAAASWEGSAAGTAGVSVLFSDRDDGVRPRLELHFHFGVPASVGASPFRVGRLLGSAPLSDSTVEDHFDGLVGGESLAEILVEVRMSARNDEHIAGHSLLGLGAGNCHPERAVSRNHGDAHRSLSSARPAKSYIYTSIGMAKARIVNFSGAYSQVGNDLQGLTTGSRRSEPRRVADSTTASCRGPRCGRPPASTVRAMIPETSDN
jgi:hypothetical protein